MKTPFQLRKTTPAPAAALLLLTADAGALLRLCAAPLSPLTPRPPLPRRGEGEPEVFLPLSPAVGEGVGG